MPCTSWVFLYCWWQASASPQVYSTLYSVPLLSWGGRLVSLITVVVFHLIRYRYRYIYMTSPIKLKGCIFRKTLAYIVAFCTILCVEWQWQWSSSKIHNGKLHYWTTNSLCTFVVSSSYKPLLFWRFFALAQIPFKAFLSECGASATFEDGASWGAI